MRRQSRKQNPEVRDDDWLDDEQWYCENKADWSGEPIHVPTNIFRDPILLKEYLKSTLGHSVEEYS